MPSEQHACPQCGAHCDSDTESCPNCRAESQSELITATTVDNSAHVYGSGYCPICQTKTSWNKGICCDCNNDESKSASLNSQGLVGDRSKHRFLAAGTDNLAAIICSFVLASQLTFLSGLMQGLAAYALYLGYFFVFEAFLSTTPAKKYFGLAVVAANGSKCTIGQVAIRTALRIFEVNPLLLGAMPAILCAYFSERSQRIGDMLAGTIVIRECDLARDSE